MADGIKAKCDFCGKPALYDGKTRLGPWAYMCQEHFDALGTCIFTKLDTAPPATKRCVICGKDKPLDEFYQYVDHTGVVRYRNECKECNLTRRGHR